MSVEHVPAPFPKDCSDPTARQLYLDDRFNNQGTFYDDAIVLSQFLKLVCGAASNQDPVLAEHAVAERQLSKITPGEPVIAHKSGQPLFAGIALNRQQGFPPVTFHFSKVDLAPDSSEARVRAKVEVALGTIIYPASCMFPIRAAAGQRAWRDVGNLVSGYTEAGPVVSSVPEVTIHVGLEEIQSIDPDILAENEFMNTAVNLLVKETAKQSG